MSKSLLKRDWFRSGGVGALVVALVVALAATGHSVTEEVEVGDVSGVALNDKGEPFPKAEVYVETYAYSADLSGFLALRTQTDAQGRFRLRNVPVGFATIRAYAPGYAAMTTILVDKEDKERKVTLTWQGDKLSLATNQPVFSPDERPRIVVNGLTRRDNVVIKLYGFSDEEIFESRNAYSLARQISRNWYSYEEDQDAPEPIPIQEIEHKIASRDIEGGFAETVELPQLDEGIYVVRAEVDGVQRHQWINVSRLGLITKVSPNGVRGFVVDIKSGEPVPNVTLDVIGPDGRKTIGTTASDGTLQVSGGPQANGDHVMLAKEGASKAFAMFYWWQGNNDRANATHITTDRTIYRPGDEVQYKGFVRTPTQDGYRLPTDRTVTVRVYDPDDTLIETETLSLNAMGAFNGAFRTIPELTGSYRLETEIDGQTNNEWIPIAAYRKPEFRIVVTPQEPYYLRGQSARFSVKVEYFTGEPVVGAKLSAWAYRSDVWRWSPFDDQDYEWWAEEWDDYGYGGEYIGDYSAVTDEEGNAVISVPTSQNRNIERSWWNSDTDQIYSLTVNGQDASGRYFEGKGSVDVVRGAVDLSVAFEDYVVQPGTSVRLRVRGNNVADEKPATGSRVTVEFGERTWNGNRSEERKLGQQTATLDAAGEALVTFRPTSAGTFYANVTLRDSGGREITDSDSLWVYSEAARFGGPRTSLQLVLDKKQYSVGENVTAVVRTDKPGGSALVTVESHDVLWAKVVKLDSEATSVAIPVTRECRPNAMIDVCYIREKTFSSSGRNLVVDMGDDRLDVRITPDRTEVLPGGVVSYIVSTRDSRGNPVQADVAVSVVDEGVYAIREDNSDPLKSFYPRRWSSVSTHYSFPEIYLDGDDKSGVNAQIRTDFRDTAHWEPSVVTGPDGNAAITVHLPENLTSWRATATAVSADARAGKGRSDVVARKPVMVRVSPPAFMVQDETQTIGATVSNETGRTQEFEVRLATSGLDVASNAIQTVSIADGGSTRLSWQVKAGKPGRAMVRVTGLAKGSGENDGLERTFEVKTNGPTLTSFHAGDTTSVAVFSMERDPGAISGNFELSLSASVLGTVLGSIDSLVDYPYGCVEQTMSRFMPAVVARQLLREAGMQRQDLDQKIEDVSAKSQARLRTMQNSSGGFGWWQYDDGSPDMTAYVLEGLYHAEKSGVQVNAHMRDRALEWSRSAMKNRTARTSYDRRDFARLAYALALHGDEWTAWEPGIPAVVSDINDPLALSYTVLAVSVARGNIPDRLKKARADAYAQLIELGSEADSTLAWADDWWNEPTAVALQAVLKMEPSSARPAKILRYLTSKRRGHSWTSTRETAQVVIGAVEYLRVSQDARPSFEASVSINGSPAGTYHFGPADLSRQETLALPATSLKSGSNVIEVRVTGQGRAYFSAMLEQQVYDPNPRPTESPSGLKIKREFFRMQPQRLEDGTVRLVPSAKPVASAQQGTVLYCRLTVTSTVERQYAMIQDPVFSAAHAIELGDLEPWNWHYWWSNQSHLDDHTAIFMWHLRTGENVVEYPVRAEALGSSIALPATVSMMYQPDIRATTGTARLTISR